MEENKEPVKETTVSENQPKFWEKFKQNAMKIGEKITTTVTDVAKNTKTAFTEAFKPGKVAQSDVVFEKSAQRFTLEDNTMLYAFYDHAEYCLIVRCKDNLKACTLLKGDAASYIVLNDEKRTSYPYLLNEDGKSISINCYKVAVIRAYSTTLNAFKQVLIYNSFLTLTPMIENFKPSFFKRNRYAEFKKNYTAFRDLVLSGGRDEKLYVDVLTDMEKLLPDAMSTLSVIDMQLM